MVFFFNTWHPLTHARRIDGALIWWHIWEPTGISIRWLRFWLLPVDLCRGHKKYNVLGLHHSEYQIQIYWYKFTSESHKYRYHHAKYKFTISIVFNGFVASIMAQDRQNFEMEQIGQTNRYENQNSVEVRMVGMYYSIWCSPLKRLPQGLRFVTSFLKS